MIQIQLREYREVDPQHDPIGRSHLGWREGMTPAEAWESARVQVLKLDRAFAHNTVEVVNLDNTVVAIVQLKGVTKVAPARPGGPLRFALEGDVIAVDPRIGKPSRYPHRTTNPVMYVAFED